MIQGSNVEIMQGDMRSLDYSSRGLPYGAVAFRFSGEGLGFKV